MRCVFVIGNIASGKSTAARYLASRGGNLIDLDALAKSLYLPGSLVVSELVDAYGNDILDEDGQVVPSKLATRAFSSEEASRRLNGIVYPHLLQRLADLLVGPQCCGATSCGYRFHVVEISVIASFTEALPLADDVIAITAPLEVRRKRAINRGMKEKDFDRRAALQPSEEDICAYATCVIDNSAGDDSLFHVLDEWLCAHGYLEELPGSVEAGAQR